MCAGISACGSESKATRAVVEVYTDLGEELASLRVQVTNELNGQQSDPTAFDVGKERAPNMFLPSFAVAPPRS